MEAIVLLIAGILVVASAWIPLFIGRLPLSLPMIAVAVGLAGGLFASNIRFFGANEGQLASWVAELAMLVAVLGGGLKLDRRFSFRGWASAWRLIGIVMLLSIAAIAATAHYLLGLSSGMSIVLGGALAPTDPVLASDYAAGPPGVGEEGEAKFALTSEAGLNDGAAFPFVTLGVLIANGRMTNVGHLLHWAEVDLVWDVAAGAAVGIIVGWVLVKVNSWLPNTHRLSASNSGLVSVGLALVAYAIAKLVDANGFIAVFCEAVAMRNLADVVKYSRRLNHAAEQFERIGMVLVFTLLGAAVVRGLFASVGWLDIAFVVIVLGVVRPLAVALGFVGSAVDRWQRLTLGYFGIRGVASLFYAAYVAPLIANADGNRIAVLTGLAVIASVMLYGTTAHAVGSFLSGGDQFSD